MDDYLKSSGPVKLLIIERALLLGRSGKRKESEKKILTHLVLDKWGNPASELRESSSIDYLYNDYHQPVKKTEKSKSGANIEEIRYSYRENLKVKEETFGPDGKIREARTFHYDKDGRLIREICGSRLYKYEYRDDCLEKEYRYYGKEPELALIYKRDQQGRITSITTIDAHGRLLREEHREWDEDRLTARKVIKSDSLVISDETFEYSCFHDGNWLKMTRFAIRDKEEKVPVETIYRSIAYSDSFPEVEPVHTNSDRVLKEDKLSLSFSDGSIYRGDITDGKMNGRGFIQWPDGTSYKGEFRENRMDGQGILTWPNGDIYSGFFTMGKMEGIGRLRWAGGKTFYGLFEDNRRTNQGIIEEN